MRTIPTIFTLLCINLFVTLSAQNYQWTWMNGDKTSQHAGIYLDDINTPEDDRKPGGRKEFAAWKDAAGNFWLFGGYGIDATGQSGYLNDLWRYNPSTNIWTWVSGDNTANQNSVYGTKGSPSPSNKPGARSGAVTWIDASGQLWLFGGYKPGRSTEAQGGNYKPHYNDLWRYNSATNTWTWVSGDNTSDQESVYTDDPDTPTDERRPGARRQAVSWIDASGQLWLFGGYYYFQGIDNFIYQQSYNDLWRFDPTTDIWTWVSGDDTADEYGIYGIKGVPAIGNKPGARSGSTGWIDASGQLWLYGGFGYGQASLGRLNDLWKFSPATNTWTWVSGGNTVNQKGVYIDEPGTYTDARKPGGRDGCASWIDVSGNAWLFGGYGKDANGQMGYLNDLWRYEAATNTWAWISGGNSIDQDGVYGTKSSPSSNNKPGSRSSAMGWSDNSNTIWLFGGFGNNEDYDVLLNDLWRLQVITSPLPVTLKSFTAVKDKSGVLLNWQTASEQNSKQFIIERSNEGITYQPIGSVTAQGNSNSLLSYQFKDASPLHGNNLYRLRLVDIDDNFSLSNVNKIVIKNDSIQVKLLQNPVTSTLRLIVQIPESQMVVFNVRNTEGNLVYTKREKVLKGKSIHSMPMTNLSKGVYYITVTCMESSQTFTVVKQ